MGISQTIGCPSGVPDWPRVASWLAEHGLPVQIRMIDGQLAFPDEEPPPNWRELRIGTPHGMITLRRQADGIELVMWGNADQELQREANAVAGAFAALSGGNTKPAEAGP